VAVNVSRTARRSSARRRNHEKKAVLMAAATPVEEAPVRDWQPILHEEVDRLPDKYRVPVVLCYLEAKTHNQAAKQLGWSVGTVKGRLARARDLLRTRLARRGLALTGAGLATLLAGNTAATTVPPALLGLTLRAAVTFAAGGTMTGTTASAGPLALAQATLQTTIGAKVLTVVALLLVVGLTTFALVRGKAPQEQRADAGPQEPERRSEKEPEPDKRNDKPDPPKGAAPVRAASDLHGDPLPPGALARLGTVRFRTPPGALFLAFLPGDKTLLTAGQALSEWEIATGKELRRWDCKGGSGSFALAPDGKTLAIGTYTDNPTVVAIYLRDAATGRVLQECRGHSGWVRSLAFAPDGRTLVSGSQDKTVRFWDVATGKELRRINEPDMVMSIALSPDGKTLATSSFHSPDAKWTIRLRDAATGKEQSSFKANVPVFHLGFAPDGKTLVALAPENGGQVLSIIYLCDVASGKVRQISGQPPCLYSAAFSPDSKTLATGSAQGIVLWDVATAKERARFGERHAYMYGLNFSSDGKLLACLNYGVIRLWDVATGKECPVPTEGHQGGVHALMFLPDGKTLASVARDRNLRLWELATGRPLRQHALPTASADAGDWFSPDGSTVAYRNGKRIAQMDVATGKSLRSFDFPEVMYFFDISQDGKLLAAYGRDRTLRLLDRTTGKELRKYAKYPDLVSGLDFAADGRTLALGVENNTIRLEDATTGEQRELLQFQSMPMAFVFSPDGKMLTVLLELNRLVQFEVATGQERLAFRMPEHAVPMAYSPDGKLLALGSEDEVGTISLREVATGKEVRRLAGHLGGVSCLAFSANGRRLASGGHDTTILTWDVADVNRDPPVAKSSPKELETLWADLADRDAARAYRAMQALAAAPKQAVPFLGRQLRPVPKPDPKRLARLIADLDDDQFEVREKATRELEGLGSSAGPALRKALEGQPSAEVRQRAERLLQRLEQFRLAPEELRGGRAVEVLERVGTTEARNVLEELTRQGSGTSPTALDAKSALDRLRRRASIP
jgi:WD40 repeat protein